MLQLVAIYDVMPSKTYGLSMAATSASLTARPHLLNSAPACIISSEEAKQQQIPENSLR